MPYVTQALLGCGGPVRGGLGLDAGGADQIRQWVPGDYTTLGTDGFGFSDTRPAARRYFNVDAASIVVAVLSALAREGTIDRSKAVEAAQQVPHRRRPRRADLARGHRQRLTPDTPAGRGRRRLPAA